MKKFEMLAHGRLKNRALFKIKPWCMTWDNISRRLKSSEREIICICVGESDSYHDKWLVSFEQAELIKPRCWMISITEMSCTFDYKNRHKMDHLIPDNARAGMPIIFSIDGDKFGIWEVNPYINYCAFILKSLR